MKVEGKRPVFRSLAKRAAYDYLETLLRTARQKLRDNKRELARLAEAQRQLKSEVAGCQQVMQEFKK